MAEQGAAVRVLLLARAGEARQRLESALVEAGAELVATIDPGEGDVAAATALAPAAVLVALEPAIEDALERFDALLSDPGVLVMFDEADVAAQRDGWDAARWVRHLAAKLNGHHDVLPPGAGTDDVVHPTPGSLPEREFDPSSIDVGALTDTAHDLAAEVPRADTFDSSEPQQESGLELALEPQQEPEPEVESGREPGFESAPTLEPEPELAPEAGIPGLLSAEDMDWSSTSPDMDATALAVDPGLAELLAGDDADAVITLDADADADAEAGTDTGAGTEAGVEADIDTDAAAGTDSAATVDPLSLGDGLSLADDDDIPSAARTGGTTAEIDLDALASRLDGLSLADPDSYGHGVLRGAVVVEAGLGGPDAVRQLLGGLDEGFARAVLVRLQLDGGRYDRLVQQMQRATSLPVTLAEVGASAEPGTVYFLAPDTGVVVDRARLVFAAAAEGVDPYAALPADDSAVLFLSGAQTARVDEAMALAADGALVIGQAPESCYDSAAVDALLAHGAGVAESGDLAQALLDRWP